MAAYQSPQPPNERMFRALIDWGHENAYQIREAHSEKGGWEGWVQEEMRNLFHSGREDNCYVNNPRKAADIVLTPQSSGEYYFNYPYVEGECVIVELKCESSFNARNFKREVTEDINKVNNGTFPPRLCHGGCNIYCIALSMTDEGDHEMESLGMSLFEMGELDAAFQVWWYMRRIEPGEFSDSEDDKFGFELDDDDDEEQPDRGDDPMQADENSYFPVDPNIGSDSHFDPSCVDEDGTTRPYQY